MVRQDFDEGDFDKLYQHINDLGVAFPIVTIYTPLPGTQLYRERYEELLTTDARLFDLLHSVLPTKLPRERFYQKFTEQRDATWRSVFKGLLPALWKRKHFFAITWRGMFSWLARVWVYRPIIRDPGSHLRDEVGKIPIDVTSTNAPRRPRPATGLHEPWHRARAAKDRAPLVQIRPRKEQATEHETLTRQLYPGTA